MKMLNFALSLTLLVSLLLISGCKSISSGSMDAYIGTDAQDCGTQPNFKGEDIYGYRADEIFQKPSLQAGAHPSDGNIDLGVNFFAATVPDLQTPKEYPIATGGVAGTAYVYYRPSGTVGDEYISVDGSGKVTVTEVELEPDEFTFRDELIILEYEISQVTMRHNQTMEEICISSLKYKGYP